LAGPHRLRGAQRQGRDGKKTECDQHRCE
jgi:hypothetical protein